MVGANILDDGRCQFRVWAPLVESVSVHITSPDKKRIPMNRVSEGYWEVSVEGISAGARYVYSLEGTRERPDPASCFQPDGVHGHSQVVDHRSFSWTDESWEGLSLAEMILYEVHIGTFTPEGTFESAIEKLDYLKETGINAVEIMPVSQFPGQRNWGYDGVYPFAVQNSYGGPDGLNRFVNACHGKGIAVLLDVVYNHLGPEGNYLWDFGPYFTDRYKTPWGQALNFDGQYSTGVRNYFIDNARYWLDHYHIDGLRLDAVHGIFDMSAKHFLRELAENVHELSQTQGRPLCLVAESDLNDPVLARLPEKCGYGIDALWCDDFHHAVHTLLTGEDNGYYDDYGDTRDLLKALKEGYVYSGQFSRFRKRDHGSSSADLPAERFVVFTQNHDQVGNRMLGERLSTLVSHEMLKVAAGIMLLSPYVPLLFMGEEYGETAPFLYFVNHSDTGLIKGIRRGRKAEFKSFGWKGAHPDPFDPAVFERSKLDWDRHSQGNHGKLLHLYSELIRLRREIPALADLSKERCESGGMERKSFFLKRWKDDSEILAIFNMNGFDMSVSFSSFPGRYGKMLDSSDLQWGGPGASMPALTEGHAEATVKAESFVLYGRSEGRES